MWTTLCVGCMIGMLYFATNKTIVIADVSQNETTLAQGSDSEGHTIHDVELKLRRTYAKENSFQVPLPDGVKPEQVVMENRYMDKELRIYIQNEAMEFYSASEISGDTVPILEGCCEPQENGILLKFQMDHVMEYKSTMEGKVLTIACYEPEELYRFIVVLDPEAGGDDNGCAGQSLFEKDITLQVAKQVQKKFSAADVRLYLTRAEDKSVSEEERGRFVEEVEPDLYIRLGLETDDGNGESYGIKSSYNEEYFFPDFGNANMADVFTKAVAISTSNRAVGIFGAEEDSFLTQLKTRGIRLSMGYLSNPKEEALLSRDTYREKLADGIVSAINEACDILRNQNTTAK